ncbi:MAG: CsbD family protein [Candidatus Dormibacteria bacterium]
MDGKVDRVAGGLKETAGRATDNKDLEAEGRRDDAAGRVKETGEKVKDRLDDMADKIKD